MDVTILEFSSSFVKIISLYGLGTALLIIGIPEVPVDAIIGRLTGGLPLPPSTDLDGLAEAFKKSGFHPVLLPER